MANQVALNGDDQRQDEEEEPLIINEFQLKLNKVKLTNMSLLNSKTFRSILSEFDAQTKETKEDLLVSFGFVDYDEAQVFINKTNHGFLISFFTEQIDNKDFDHKFKFEDLIEIFSNKVKQRQICNKLMAHANDIIREMDENKKEMQKQSHAYNRHKLNPTVTQYNITVLVDNQKNKPLYIEANNSDYPKSCSSIATTVNNESTDSLRGRQAKQQTTILLIYSNVNRNNEDTIRFIDILKELNIKYIDFVEEFHNQDNGNTEQLLRNKIADTFNKVDAIFLLYDEAFSDLIDDKKNPNKNCIYKYIVRLMYNDYIRKQMTKRYHTFLCDDCSSIKYNFLQNSDARMKPISSSALSSTASSNSSLINNNYSNNFNYYNGAKNIIRLNEPNLSEYLNSII